MNSPVHPNNSHKKVIIIGAGLAGLSTACFLSSAGYRVEVIESSSKPGGRAYSFTEKSSNSVIDNGQHILMGCYSDTLKFFELIGASKNFIVQDNLRVNFIKENRNLYPLKASFLFYPFNLLFGLLNYSAVSFSERLGLLRVFLKLYFYSSKDLEKLTVAEWLAEEKQSERIIKAFWEIVAVGALNADIKKASAKIFVDILKKIFFRGNKATAIVLPAAGLSESYCLDAETFIKNNGGEIKYSETVTQLEIHRNKIKAINTGSRRISDFDYVVTAVPLYALKKILPGYNEKLPELKYSSILSLHIWLSGNKFKDKFYGLINSPVHWLFNHSEHITLVISSADEYMEKTHEEIFNLCMIELQKYFGFDCADVKSYRVIKEKRATFIPSNDILKGRPGAETIFKNMFIAGDWTNTGLPATIEGAVKSGRTVSNLITKF